MIGQRFGYLTVLAKEPRHPRWNLSRWRCMCDCGSEVIVYGRLLRNSKHPSCGCVQAMQVASRATKYRTLDDYLANTKMNNGCLEWQGHVTTAGYGFVGSHKGKHTEQRSGLVHRRVYTLVTGDSPTVVMHTCDNRKCINPKHLKGGTQRDNIKDAANKKRMWMQSRALTTTYKGEVVTFSELAKTLGVALSTIYARRRAKKPLY